jgi:hypothetical protein
VKSRSPLPARYESEACGDSIVGLEPAGAWMFVCCERRILSGRGLCVELTTRPDECVVVCDLEVSRINRPWPGKGSTAKGKES